MYILLNLASVTHNVEIYVCCLSVIHSFLLLNSIRLYKYTMIYLFSVDEHLDCIQFLAIMSYE